MKTLHIILATVAVLALIGCGGGSGGAPDNNAGIDGEITEGETNNPDSGQVANVDNIESILDSLSSSSKLVSGSDKKVCQNIDENSSYTLDMYLKDKTDLDVYYNRTL